MVGIQGSRLLLNVGNEISHERYIDRGKNNPFTGKKKQLLTDCGNLEFLLSKLG